MADDIIRKLPFSAIAEQSLLGSILTEPSSLDYVADMISSDDFYLEEHKQIYLAMHELFLTNSQIDIVTLIDTLVRKGIYSKSGGEEYIKVIAQTVPNALNIKDYAKIVKDKSILRKLIDMCGEISDMAYSEQDEVTNLAILSELVKISTDNPRKAIARRKFQKNRVPNIIAKNTPHAVAWCISSAPETHPSTPAPPDTAIIIKKRHNIDLVESSTEPSSSCIIYLPFPE